VAFRRNALQIFDIRLPRRPLSKTFGVVPRLRDEGGSFLLIWLIRTAIGRNHRVLRRFFLPANYANWRGLRKEISDEVLLECRASSHRFWACTRFDPKRYGDVSHSESFAKSSNQSFALLFALIRVIRGLKFGCGFATLGNPWFSSAALCALCGKSIRVIRGCFWPLHIRVHSCPFVVSPKKS